MLRDRNTLKILIDKKMFKVIKIDEHFFNLVLNDFFLYCDYMGVYKITIRFVQK